MCWGHACEVGEAFMLNSSHFNFNLISFFFRSTLVSRYRDKSKNILETHNKIQNTEKLEMPLGFTTIQQHSSH